MNARMRYLLGEELRKLFRGGKLKVLLSLSFLIGIFIVFIGNRMGVDDSLPLTAIELLRVIILPVFMVSLGSDIMISEFKDRTIKHGLKLPLSREVLYLGKLLAGWIAGALILLSMFIPPLIGTVMLFGIPTLPAL